MFEEGVFDRWADKVLVDGGCWTWLGAKDRDGYGQFRYTPKFQGKAHRFAYEVFRGPITKGLSVLHTCDNPSCVNPSHLYVGTNSDNMQDRSRRDRYDQRGFRNPAWRSALRRIARPHEPVSERR